LTLSHNLSKFKTKDSILSEAQMTQDLAIYQISWLILYLKAVPQIKEIWWANYHQWLPTSKHTNFWIKSLTKDEKRMTRNSSVKLMNHFKSEDLISVTFHSIILMLECHRAEETSLCILRISENFWSLQGCQIFVKKFSRSLIRIKLETTSQSLNHQMWWTRHTMRLETRKDSSSVTQVGTTPF
jgi:hypothetical protein